MNFGELIKDFFEENEFNRLAQRVSVIRHDGIDLYTNIDNKLEASSIGALVSGLWQAAQSLSRIIEDQTDFFEFRLAFDTSSSGLYVLPFSIEGNDYYICAIYTDKDNPAKLKQYIRQLKESLESYLVSMIESKEDNKDEYLFNDISDEEMDNLFSFARN